jgi:primosomal protein N' (replication factor Y)
VRIIFRTPNEERTQKEAERAAQILRKQIKDRQLTGTDLIGPAPCFFTKVNRFYRWHLLLRGPNPKAALDGMDLPKGWFIDVDPVDVL